MSEFVVATIPIEAKANPPKLGILISGVIVDYIGRHYGNVTPAVAVNLLDTYRDRNRMLLAMAEAQEKVGVDKGSLWVDSEHTNELYEEVQHLIEKGHVTTEKAAVMRCSEDCKKVEMLAMVERKAKSKQYEAQGNDLVCRHCHSKIVTKDEWVLLMNYSDKLTPPITYPHILERDIEAITKSLEGKKYLVSKSRNTGLPISVENRNFNLDIDFLLMNYLGVLSKGKNGVIMVGSDHVKTITTQYAAVFQTGNGPENPKPVMTVSPFYILNTPEFKEYVENGYMAENNPNLLRLLTLSSISWSKDGQWNTSLLKYLHKKAENISCQKTTRTTLEAIPDARETLDTIRRSVIQKAVDSKDFSGLGGMIV